MNIVIFDADLPASEARSGSSYVVNMVPTDRQIEDGCIAGDSFATKDQTVSHFEPLNHNMRRRLHVNHSNRFDFQVGTIEDGLLAVGCPDVQRDILRTLCNEPGLARVNTAPNNDSTTIG